jgi:hypothetical protein
MERKPAVAVVFHHIGPYHHARLNAAACSLRAESTAAFFAGGGHRIEAAFLKSPKLMTEVPPPKKPAVRKLRSALRLFEAAGFDLLLHVVHHGHRCDQHDGCNYLVRVKAGMENAPGDAHSRERLHHLEIARC